MWTVRDLLDFFDRAEALHKFGREQGVFVDPVERVQILGHSQYAAFRFLLRVVKFQGRYPYLSLLDHFIYFFFRDDSFPTLCE